MTLVQLKHFLELAANGSFSKSAERLYLTQPALSRSIKSLEDELGQSLFDRVGRKNELTPFGQHISIGFGAWRIVDDAPSDLRRQRVPRRATLDSAWCHHFIGATVA